jgi:hypothetical protein
MSIDKSIRQYYSRGQLVQPGPGRPGYQGGKPPGVRGREHAARSSPDGGGDGRSRALQTIAAQAPTRSRQESEAAEAVVAAAQAQAAKQEANRVNRLAEARKLMTSPGLDFKLEPNDPKIPDELEFFDGQKFTARRYDPYKDVNYETGEVKQIGKAPDFITGGDLHKDPVAIDQGFVDTKPKPKIYTPPVRHHGIDTGEEAFEMVGGVKVPLSMRGVKGVDPREDPERYFEKPGVDPFQVPEMERTIEQKLEIEKWESAQDWDKIQKLSDRGYSFEEIQGAMKKGLLTKADPQSMKTNFGLRSLRNIMPETNLEKRLLGGLKKSFADTGKNYLENYAKKAATNFALKKLGLGAFIPWLGIASLFFPGKKDAFVSKFPKRKGTAIEPVAWQGGDDRVSEDIVTTSVKKFKPTKSQEDQIAEINRKRLILLEHARTGRLNETGQNTLAQFDKLLKQYKTSPETLWT